MINNLKIIFKKYWWGVLVVLLFLGWWLIDIGVRQAASGLIYGQVETAPSKPVALVLGARVIGNKVMSSIFEDRVETARRLYAAGKVEKILISGDHSQKYYDEVNIAKRYLLEHGVPTSTIFLDHAGLDTYDSLYRAKHIFGVKSLLVVTQDFHLPRALYLARHLDIDAAGVSADLHKYVNMNRIVARESLARVKAFLDTLFGVKPKYLGPTIDMSGDSRASWDQPEELKPAKANSNN